MSAVPNDNTDGHGHTAPKSGGSVWLRILWIVLPFILGPLIIAFLLDQAGAVPDGADGAGGLMAGMTGAVTDVMADVVTSLQARPA